MTADTDAQASIDFLLWLFGDEPDGLIYACGIREGANGEKIPGEHRYWKSAVELDTDWWQRKSQHYNFWHCTGTVKNKKDKKSAENVLYVPALWFDIDGCKKIFDPQTKEPVVSGSEFLGELRATEGASAWVRSSKHGLQGYFKLKDPVLIDGDKERFNDELQPLLLDIAWHYGADLATTHIGTLMRLPGTLNVKREYRQPYEVKAYTTENVHTLSSLAKRFKLDFDGVPKLVTYALTKIVQQIWEDGQRNAVSLQLAGSVRKMGLDRKSCERLFFDLHKVLIDDVDRQSEVASTYERAIDEIATLRSGEFTDCADAVDSALKFWLDLKIKYAKKRGLEFHPEIDPLKSRKSAGNRMFYSLEGQTYFIDDKGEQKRVSNFTMRVTRRVLKAQDRSITWVAEVLKPGSSPCVCEIPADKHNSWQKFSTIKPMPSGIGFDPTTLWTPYVMQVDEEAEDTPIVKESTYYGFLGLEKGTPVLLLPDQERDDYMWSGGDDTALPGALLKEVSPKQTRRYLKGLAEHYPIYHDRTYGYPALGWFAACSLSAFMRFDHRIHGFPTLLITGLAGSGKSTLVTNVLKAHYGCNEVKSFAQKATTAFAIKRRLSSNNVAPYVLDEFRDESDTRTQELQGLIRTLWGEIAAEQGTQSGQVRTDRLEAPLCVIGEHPYSDRAALDRTFSIRVNPQWVKSMRNASNKTKNAHNDAVAWLHDPKHTGTLGSLLLRFVNENLDYVYGVIDAALELVDKTCPVGNERKRKGFAAIFAGMFILAGLYKQHGLKFFIDKTEMLEAVYGADPLVDLGKSQDVTVLRTLFLATDKIIVDALRKGVSHEGYLYCFDLEDSNIVYLQINRWFEEVCANVRASNSAALKHDRAFIDLLKENVGKTIIGFPDDHPRFRQGCVKVNTAAVADNYQINVENWRQGAEEL